MGQQSEFANFVWAHWRMMLWASNIGWWMSELWIFGRDLRRTRGLNADRFSRLIIVLSVAASIAAALWCIRAVPSAALPNGDFGAVRFAFGIALMWVGIGLREWAVATLGAFFRTSVVVQDDHRLITTGPYRRIRNPSYTGAMITILGQGLTFGNWLALLVCVAGVFAAFWWRIHVESNALRERFGQAYDEYAKRSWALIPWVW